MRVVASSLTTDGRDGGPLTASALIRGVVDCFSVPIAGGSVAACGCFLVVYPAAVGAPSTKSAVAMFLAVIRCCPGGYSFYFTGTAPLCISWCVRVVTKFAIMDLSRWCCIWTLVRRLYLCKVMDWRMDSHETLMNPPSCSRWHQRLWLCAGS